METTEKERLDHQIAVLNWWLSTHAPTAKDYNLVLHDRNWYVRRLIEMEGGAR